MEPRRILGQCKAVAAGTNATACIDDIDTGYWKRSNNINKRLGVSIVPYHNPAAVAFPGDVNIPWSPRMQG